MIKTPLESEVFPVHEGLVGEGVLLPEFLTLIIILEILQHIVIAVLMLAETIVGVGLDRNPLMTWE